MQIPGKTSVLGRTAVVVAASIVLIGGSVGCTIDTGEPSETNTWSGQPIPGETFTMSPSQTTGASSAARSGAENAAEPLAGKTIYLDPGHAAVIPANVPQVPDGRGGTKPCQVSGASSNEGWPEAAFNWEMYLALRESLEHAGATVLATREDNTSEAPCIDQRVADENASNADVVVSLHADGSTEGNRGFHIIVVSDPLPENDAAGSTQLAELIRDQLVDDGFATSNYLGSNGIDYRSDLTGLNLSSKPKVLIEFGNMRDSVDIGLLQSAQQRERFATAITAGIIDMIGDTHG